MAAQTPARRRPDSPPLMPSVMRDANSTHEHQVFLQEGPLAAECLAAANSRRSWCIAHSWGFFFGLFRLSSVQTCLGLAAEVTRKICCQQAYPILPLGMILSGVTSATAEITDATLSLNAPSKLAMPAHVAVSKTVSCSFPPRQLVRLRHVC